MKDKLFYTDINDGSTKSYQDLIDDLNKESVYYKYCRKKSFYDIFKNIVFSLLLDEEIILLDIDFSDDEIIKLVGDLSSLDSYVAKPANDVFTIDRIKECLERQNGNWRVTLFTSGTTGMPKKVSHSLESITRYAKYSDKHKDDVWGFAYNPTHMAGLQVFMQAVLNFNSVVRLFGLSRDEILTLITKEHITHISATPTFYRLLLPSDNEYPLVSRITSGGEKFDLNTMSELQKMFVNAKFINVYASTEAGTLFAAQGDSFVIKDEVADLVKIVNDELYLHRSLMGEAEGIRFEGDWYPTGDLITIINNAPFTFKFISRKNEMINVGGYKVNPTEIEEVLRSYPGVEDAFVFAKQNRILGNLVCAEVVCFNDGISEKDIRSFLDGKLQEFKIPRMIKFVKQLNVTRTGKIARNNR